jgi:hypothetical protein
MVVIATDEARTIAAQIEDEDPKAAADLVRFAGLVDNLLAGKVSGELAAKISGEIEMVPPKIVGPDALQDWVGRYRDNFRGAYRHAVAAGYAEDTVVWGMPRTESLDDQPVAFDLRSWPSARNLLAKVGMGRSLDDSPPEEMFAVVASKGAGRFKGTFVGWLPKPAAGELLPQALVVERPGDAIGN